MFQAGEKLSIPLEGYETAVYEVYPLEEATLPLIGGVAFDVISSKEAEQEIQYHSVSSGANILNPAVIKSMKVLGKDVNPRTFSFAVEPTPIVITEGNLKSDPKDQSKVNARFTLSETAKEATLAILLTPDTTLNLKTKPSLSIIIDGKEASVKSEGQEGRSQWYTSFIQPGKHVVTVEVRLGKGEREWRGNASVWIIAQQRQNTREVSFTTYNRVKERPMPPHPWGAAEVRKNEKLGEAPIDIPRRN